MREKGGKAPLKSSDVGETARKRKYKNIISRKHLKANVILTHTHNWTKIIFALRNLAQNTRNCNN